MLFIISGDIESLRPTFAIVGGVARPCERQSTGFLGQWLCCQSALCGKFSGEEEELCESLEERHYGGGPVYQTKVGTVIEGSYAAPTSEVGEVLYLKANLGSQV